MAATKKSTVCVEASDEAVEVLLAFPVADRWFALPADSVVAVVEADRLQPLASDSGGIIGYVEVRGGEVLVRDMTTVLVPGASSRPAEQIILFRGVSSWAGLTTMGTAEMVSVSAEQIESDIDLGGSGLWKAGTCRAEDRTITVLDPEVLAGGVGSLC